MEKESILTNSNLLIIQLLGWIDEGRTDGINEMTSIVSSSRLDKYLITCYN